MTKGASSKTRPSPEHDAGPFPVFDPAELNKIGNRNMQVATRAARAYFDGASKLHREMMSFVNDRFRKDFESARAFMSAKNSETAFHTQAEFVEEAIRDYADGASKMLHLAADMAHETLAPVEERAEEVLHEIDERAEAPAAAG